MRIPNKERIEQLKRDYPRGCKVELLKMDDFQAPPIGTRGTVMGVDDMGSIMVNWETGSSLSVVYGEDRCRVIPAVTTICYKERKEWATRDEAAKFFRKAYMGSDGSEAMRYGNIYAGIKSGLMVCRDEEDDDDE